MSDLISRQAAIYAIEKRMDDITCEEFAEGMSEAITEISLLPSAQTDFDITVKIDKAYDDGYSGIYVKEEDVLKFYYVESEDDYWIGRRLDNFYYATWDRDLQNFVWSYSRYLPWGEHIVAPDTLWKEHTYPSEPKEIPLKDWLKGFYAKYFMPAGQPEIIRCKDCKWWTKQEDSLQGRCELYVMYPTGEWFCANARGKEE